MIQEGSLGSLCRAYVAIETRSGRFRLQCLQPAAAAACSDSSNNSCTIQPLRATLRSAVMGDEYPELLESIGAKFFPIDSHGHNISMYGSDAFATARVTFAMQTLV